MHKQILTGVLILLFSGCRVGAADRDGDGYPDCSVEYWPTYRYIDDCLEGADEAARTSTGVVYSSPYGYYNPSMHDCHDGNPEIHPDAEEICDGWDNDCSGSWDDWTGAIEDAPEELDCDGDGYIKLLLYGDEQTYEQRKLVSDCDPWDAAIYPGAPELEDGLDNDCDGCPDNFDGEDCETESAPESPDEPSGCGCTVSPSNGLPFGLAIPFLWIVPAMARRS